MSKTTKENYFISQNIAYMVQALEGSLKGTPKDDFNNLKTDIDRFKFLWERKEVHEIITIEKEFKEKSIEIAKIHREKGNLYFQKDQYLSALNEYNICLINAPTIYESQCKNELALGFANRSASLFHLKQFKECIIDIGMAIDNNYPMGQLHKLYDRRGSSYYNLKDFSKAYIDFSKAKDLINSLDEKEKKNWTKVIDKKLGLLQEADVTKQIGFEFINNISNKCKINIELGVMNPFYPNLSEMVAIKTTDVLGNHAIACCDIDPNQVLALEKPYVSVMFENAYQTRCYNCWQVIKLPIPCNSCALIVFCSLECRDNSWQNYHKYECAYQALFSTTVCGNIGHLAIRLLMKHDCHKLVEFLKCSLNNSISSELIDQLKQYSLLYNLEMHMKQRACDQSHFEFAFLACFLIKLLITMGYIEFAETSEEFFLLGMCLIHHLYLLQCNAKLINQVQNVKKFDEPNIKPIGVGIYLSISLINHSCDPSAEINFYDDVAAVKSLRTIHQWDDVTFSYGPLFYKDKKLKRQKQLISSYYFRCNCVACTENWPIADEMFNEIPTYQCGNCRKILTQEDLHDKKTYECKLCGERLDLDAIVMKLHDSYDSFAYGMNSAMNGNVEDALPIFFQHLNLLQKHIRHPWRDLASCQNAIKHCYAFLANINK